MVRAAVMRSSTVMRDIRVISARKAASALALRRGRWTAVTPLGMPGTWQIRSTGASLEVWPRMTRLRIVRSARIHPAAGNVDGEGRIVTTIGSSDNNRSPQIQFNAPDVMRVTSMLILNGRGPSGNGNDRIRMNQSATIGGLVIDGVAQVATQQLNLTSFTVSAPVVGTCHWRVDSYLDGNTSTHPQNFAMAGDALIAISRSTSAHHKDRTLTGVISGTGKLSVHSTNGQRLTIQNSNPWWSGGIVTGGTLSENKNESLRANAAGAFGTGDVTVNDGVGLLISVANAIADTATLTLNGGNREQSFKLTLDASDTVAKLFVDGIQLPAGPYTSASGLVDSAGSALIGGSGTLTVTGGSAPVRLLRDFPHRLAADCGHSHLRHHPHREGRLQRHCHRLHRHRHLRRHRRLHRHLGQLHRRRAHRRERDSDRGGQQPDTHRE